MNPTTNSAARRNGPALAALLIVAGLLATACGGAAAPVGSTSALAATAVRGRAATAAPVAASNTKPSNLNCAALTAAMLDLSEAESSFVVLTGSASAVNRLDSPFYVDTAKLRGDLDVLAAVPAPSDAAEVAMMGTPSESIAQYRQMLDLIDSAAKASGPAATAVPDASGQQLLGFTAKLVRMYTGLGSALDTACPDQPTPAPPGAQGAVPATPLTAGYQIGQAAPVGDLQVTLNKVANISGAGALLPEPGSRFVIAYFTVENKGSAPFGMNMLINTRFEDTAGQAYRVDPYGVSLDVQITNLEGTLAAGEKRSGAAVYQVPMGASDLLWLFEDARPNRVVFAVPAAAVLTVGTPVSEPTEDALRAGAAATQTAFVGMMMDGVATQDALGGSDPPTDVPAPDAPTDTPDVSAGSDPPTDVPAPDAPTDTP